VDEFMVKEIHMTLEQVKSIISSIKCHLFSTVFRIRVERDNKDPDNGRIFLQICYDAFCSRTGVFQNDWHGRKWYLSDYMTVDEIVKTCYAAFKAAVEHECMEGFKVNDIIVFNPHINHEELLKISDREVKRT
jgi:hypothetical protein